MELYFVAFRFKFHIFLNAYSGSILRANDQKIKLLRRYALFLSTLTHIKILANGKRHALLSGRRCHYPPSTTMIKRIIGIAACLMAVLVASAQKVIEVDAAAGDMTGKLQAAINQARRSKGHAVTIALQNADYHIYRTSSTKEKYYISNTTSEAENPDVTKHIGLWLKGLKNVTIDGRGARLITHGEMTSFVVDGCENITLKNFTIDAADPTVPELTVTEVGSNHLNVKISPKSKYTIDNGRFAFVGESWSLSGGIAQAYDASRDVTWRCWSPLTGISKAIELEPGLLRFNYASKPQAQKGWTFQMRDAIRDEACGLIQYSRNVTLENLHLAFLGNFGLVGQMSDNITYRRLTFAPEEGSGRTCAGFADFVQMSGCKGRILIEDSRFCGAHDDPINVHGTHLAVKEFISPTKIRLRYMHPQTYGFQSFLPGNEVDIVDSYSLLPLASFRVKKAVMESPREIVVTLNSPVPEAIRKNKDLVVENVTYTPEVVVRNNYFSRIPSRGLLVTTRRKVVIENNTFFRMQMSGILIADDARSWYESGMVRDVTIRNNRFIECGEPVILIAPENHRDGGCVHRNIRILGNRFVLNGENAVNARSVDGLKVEDNLFQLPQPTDTAKLITTDRCRNLSVRGNRVAARD